MVAEMVHVLHQRHVAETETETPSMVTGLVVTGVVSLVIEWVIRVAVVLSVSAHVALALLAGIRRRHAYGCRISILWLAYQGAGWAAPYVLSNLFLGSTPHERQLVVLWLPCVVAHLGGADNITAYSLEDNKLSLRLYLSALLQVMSIAFLLYKQVKIATGSQGALFWASVVMVGVGAFKYLERVGAFWKADFGNMRGSGKNSKPARSFRIQPRAGRKKLLGNEQALLLAHELICITTGAFGDFSFKENDLRDDAGLKQIFSVQPRDDTGWENMRKVVEMELSLMYDILYTKAAVIHVWSGYAVRVVSPVVTATVAVLFWLHSEDGQRRADVVIIYVLLAVTFLLDVRWLFGAAASTWAYAFFNARPASWLHHQVCCSGRWHRLRSFVVSLDLWQHGGGYRLWSGTMGQYNLLQEVTHGGTSRFISCLINTLALEDAWMEYKCSSRLKLDHSKNVEELLFKQIQKAFKMEKLEEKKPEAAKPELKKPEEIKPPVAAQALQRRRHLDEELGFLPEFQELILIWHVTTDVFILASQQQLIPDHTKYVEAIQAVSDYMAFLAAVRPNMLPGLKLRSLHQATRQALDSLWEEYRRSSSAYTGPSSTTTGDKEQLVEFLKNMEHEMPNGNSNRSALYEFSIVLSEGIRFAELLPQVLTSQDRKATLHSVLQEGSNSWKRFMFLIPEMEEEWPKLFSMMGLLELILRSWVRMLIYVSIRCGRDCMPSSSGVAVSLRP